jgi:hypothetical protein
VADSSHIIYADAICELVYISAYERGTGIAKRSPDYIAQKMAAGKAVIALDGKELVGFHGCNYDCYLFCRRSISRA